MTAPLKDTMQEEIDKYGLEINKVYNEDCLIGMKKIKDKSIDMILCDLPYGTTQCKWDSIIPLNDYIEVEVKKKLVSMNQGDYKIHCFDNNISSDEFKSNWKKHFKKGLWSHYNRIIKDNGAIVLTSAQPFTSVLIDSNIKNFKYTWIWNKNKATGHLNAKKQPLRSHEEIVVFYKKPCIYNPQGTIEGVFNSMRPAKGNQRGEVYGQQRNDYGHSTVGNYPKTTISFPVPHKPIHPTQKPTELFDYLINTYTNEGDVVLDNCIGSGTTAISSINTNRKYIGYELNQEYYAQTRKRINDRLNL